MTPTTTVWCSVPFLRLTLTIFRRASSIAFCTATGTSRDLPFPIPIRPSPSPTTVKAANPRIRPPFNDFRDPVDRDHLLARMPSSGFSACCDFLLCGFAITYSDPIFVRSELEASLTRSFGQRLDPSVVLKPAAVERNLGDTRLNSALRDQLPDNGWQHSCYPVSQFFTQRRLERRSRCDNLDLHGEHHTCA